MSDATDSDWALDAQRQISDLLGKPTKGNPPVRSETEAPETTKKRCRKCGWEFPATNKYFYTNNALADRLQSSCITCDNSARKARDATPKNRSSADRRNARFGRYCGVCCGMSHRRTSPACAGCGEPFEEESIPKQDAHARHESPWPDHEVY